MNRVIIPIVIGIIIVGGLAVFSIYLQQNEAVVAIERMTNPNYQCWEKYDYLQQQQAADPNYKFDEENQKIGDEIRDARCYDSFREWMPEDHPNWNQMVARENRVIDNCGKYLRGEIEMSELDRELFENWDCERFQK